MKKIRPIDNNSVPSNESMIKLQPAKESLEVLLTSSSISSRPDNRLLKSEPNELKASHPNENVYLSTIVDKALRDYHDLIFKEKGSQIWNISD